MKSPSSPIKWTSFVQRAPGCTLWSWASSGSACANSWEPGANWRSWAFFHKFFPRSPQLISWGFHSYHGDVPGEFRKGWCVVNSRFPWTLPSSMVQPPLFSPWCWIPLISYPSQSESPQTTTGWDPQRTAKLTQSHLLDSWIYWSIKLKWVCRKKIS